LLRVLRVIGPSDRLEDAASGAMRREAAISRVLVGAEKIWVGYAELGPGTRSAVHHHGEAESAIYVVSGRARFFTGARGEILQEAGPGDFVWVPPQAVHLEMNSSDTEPVRMVVARSTQETLVFNLPVPEGWLVPR
jgi:uncharacterized RmlC-like cupin family protein